jgi:hypothetical protein
MKKKFAKFAKCLKEKMTRSYHE